MARNSQFRLNVRGQTVTDRGFYRIEFHHPVGNFRFGTNRGWLYSMLILTRVCAPYLSRLWHGCPIPTGKRGNPYAQNTHTHRTPKSSMPIPRTSR